MPDRQWLIMCCFVMSVAPVWAGGLRCGNQVISEGALARDVAAACGEPVAHESFQEQIPGASITTGVLLPANPAGESQTATAVVQPVYRTVDRWIYDPGEGRLPQQLEFVDGRLRSIRTSGGRFD